MALSANSIRGLARYLVNGNQGAALKRLVIKPEKNAVVYEPFYLGPTEVPSGTLAEGSIWFDDDNHALSYYNGTANVEVVTTVPGAGADGGGLVFNFPLKPFSTVTEYDLLIAPFAFQVTGIKVVPSTLQGGALTATLVKATGTAAPSNGTTPLHTADAINLNTGAYTVQTITLTGTTANLQFAAGDRLGIDFSAAYTAGHAVATVLAKRI